MATTEDAILNDTSPVCMGTLAKTVQLISKQVASFIRGKNREIEARLKALEQRPTLKYVGVFVHGLDYEAGNFCTHSGSLWHCNVSRTKARPGDNSDWQLAAKKGRDA